MNRKTFKYQVALIMTAIFLCTPCLTLAAESGVETEAADLNSARQTEDNGDFGEEGTILVSVDGEDWLFYLESAHQSLDKMWVTYYAFNPRGETYYKLRISLSDDVKPGEYETASADATIAFYTDNTVGKNGAIQNINAQFMSTGRKAGTLVVETRSSDWLTYKGSFETDVENYAGEKVHIKCNSFEFTLGEERELPYQNDWEEDSGSTTFQFQNDPFF